MVQNFSSFEWLLWDTYHVRANLRDVRTAIRRGQMDGEEHAGRRKALIETLATLQEQPGLSGRAIRRIAGIYFEMMRRDLEKA